MNVEQVESKVDSKATRKARLSQYRKHDGRWQFFAVARRELADHFGEIDCIAFRGSIQVILPGWLAVIRPELEKLEISPHSVLDECVGDSRWSLSPKDLQAQLNPLRWSGRVRILLPVAAKMALLTAGKVGGSVGSPRPVGA
jgi:hypothetical protein